MKKSLIIITAVIAGQAALAASLHCGKDTDCKGDRICEDGKCVSPMAGCTTVLPSTDTAPAGQEAKAPASDIPKFRDYPAPPVYTGPPGKLQMDSELARNFRTRLGDAMKEDEVAFAGEYVLTGWGCGTGGCYIQALVNKRTGHVIDTTFDAYSTFANDKEIRLGEEIESMRTDSTLLVTREVSEDPPHQHFANFYVLENGRLKRIKQLPAPH